MAGSAMAVVHFGPGIAFAGPLSLCGNSCKLNRTTINQLTDIGSSRILNADRSKLNPYRFSLYPCGVALNTSTNN